MMARDVYLTHSLTHCKCKWKKRMQEFEIVYMLHGCLIIKDTELMYSCVKFSGVELKDTLRNIGI
jgi:hypothetical protein